MPLHPSVRALPVTPYKYHHHHYRPFPSLAFTAVPVATLPPPPSTSRPPPTSENPIPRAQVSGRFALSAGENIGAGDANEFTNRELWARAAGLSGVSATIESLPLGYDTVLEDVGGPSALGTAVGGAGAMGR